MSPDYDAYEFNPGSLARDTENGVTGTIVELGDEEALVEFPLLGCLWVPYGELLPGSRVIGED